jgi:hypothetical protein
LGCESAFPSKYNSYCEPTLQDTPEAAILHIIDETISFITEQISQHNPVLVHCVYGQSRSAVVCGAYLISIGMSFDEALTHLKSCHPNICINPGFLAQLFLHTFRATYSVQYHLINPHASREMRPRTDMIQCKDCLRPLVCLEDAIDLSQEEGQIQEAIKLFIDPFWQDYHSLYSSLSTPHNLSSDLLVVRPSEWMINEAQSTPHRQATKPDKKKRRKEMLSLNDLHCCGCKSVIGRYRSKEEGGIRLAGGYLLGQLYCIDRHAVLIPSDDSIQNTKERDITPLTSEHVDCLISPPPSLAFDVL